MVALSFCGILKENERVVKCEHLLTLINLREKLCRVVWKKTPPLRRRNFVEN